ncbi:MAG: T9SS type A sorting domain-containing protein [Bacteroidota bacterium]
MKKLYTLLLISSFALVSLNAKAYHHYITVGASGNTFAPAAINVMVGDTVTWALVQGAYNVVSVTGGIPSLAAPFASANPMSTSTPFSYTILYPGVYHYNCSYYPSTMTGTITASGAGITNPSMTSITFAFPNPCTDKLIFKFNGIDKIVLYNVVGEQVKATELASNEGTLEMNLEGMPSGLYFYSTFKEGVVFETRRVVKK